MISLQNKSSEIDIVFSDFHFFQPWCSKNSNNTIDPMSEISSKCEYCMQLKILIEKILTIDIKE